LADIAKPKKPTTTREGPAERNEGNQAETIFDMLCDNY